jgi:replicative DNA helicase
MRESVEEKWKNRTRLKLNQFSKLGDKIYSFDHGRCMLLPGMSGTGKTGTAIQLANDIAKCQEEEFLIMSLEMDDAGIAERMAKIAYYMNTPPDEANMYHSNLFFEQNRTVEGFYNKVMPDRMHVCDKTNLSIHQIFNVAKYEVSKNPKIKTIIIDYAQLINTYPLRPSEGLDQVSIVVARIGKELGVRVILLSQLTKDNYDGSRPTPASIKGSGGLFDNMDIVLCLYRNKDEWDGKKLEFIHMKDRQNGSEGTTEMHINGLHITSVDLSYFQKKYGEG